MYSFSPSTRRIRTVSPCCTGFEDSARQSSPWTRTMPSAPAGSGSTATPCNPISSSFPVAVFHWRERNTKRIKTTARTANGNVPPSATPMLTPPEASGERSRKIALYNPRKECLARRKFGGRTCRIFQRQRHVRAVESRDGSAVQLPNQLVSRVHDQIDHLRVQRFFFGKRPGFRDRLFRKLGVAFALYRKTSQKRHGVLIDFPPKYLIDLLGKSTDCDDGRSRTRMRAGSHRGDVGRQKYVKTCGSSARARRRNVHGHGHGRSKDVLNHVLHRIAQPAGRVHGD